MVSVIILAAGEGKRTQNALPKQYYKIGSKMLLEYTIDCFSKITEVSEIILVNNLHYMNLIKHLKIKTVPGGKTRQESSYQGLKAVSSKNVLIHDAARPFVSKRIILECINKLQYFKAIDVVINSPDTIVKVKDDSITEIPLRSTLRKGQTPQAFHTGTILKAHKLFMKDKNKPIITDDCALIMHYNLGEVKIVIGDEKNIKITYPHELDYAEFLLNKR